MIVNKEQIRNQLIGIGLKPVSLELLQNKLNNGYYISMSFDVGGTFPVGYHADIDEVKEYKKKVVRVMPSMCPLNHTLRKQIKIIIEKAIMI